MNVHEKAAWDELAERNAKLEARNAKLERVVQAARSVSLYHGIDWESSDFACAHSALSRALAALEVTE